MPDTQKPEKSVDIRKYLDIIFRRRYLFLSILALVSIISIVYSYTIKKQYESTATLLVEKNKVINPLMRGLAVPQSGSERLRTIRQLIVSRSRLLEVIKKLDLDLNIETPLQLEGLINAMRKAVNLKLIGRSLYTISFEGDNPETTRDVVNTICNIFIEENLKATRGSAHEAFAFIETQLDVYRGKLEGSEKVLRLYKEKNLDQMPRKENINITKLGNYVNLLAAAELELKDTQLQKSLLGKQLVNEKPFVPAFSISNNPSKDNTSLEFQLAQLNSRLNFLLTKYTEKYPDVIQLKVQIELIKQKLSKQAGKKEQNIKTDDTESVTMALNPIHQKLKENLGNAVININIIESRIDEYKKRIDLFTAKVEGVPKREEELARLQRGYDVNLGIFKTLLGKLEEARISRELELRERGENFQIIDTAQLPLIPSKPDRPKLILMSLALALITSLAVNYLFYYLDNSIADADEAKSYFNYPVLAGIPFITTDSDIKKKRKSNFIFFSAAGLFFISILTLLIKESIIKFKFF